PETSWDGKAWEAEGVTMAATAQGDNYILSGAKLFVEFAKVAEYMLVAARTQKTGKAENAITLFLVDAKTAGITSNLLVTTGGDKQCEVIFDNVKVPKANMVGKLNAGWEPLAKAMKLGSVLLSAQMVGADRKMLELAVDYAKTRTQFEVPIGVWQYVQEHCVMILTELDSSWWLTYDAAWKLSKGESADMEVALAKGYCSDSHERACWRAHQVYGGVGYTILDGVMPLYSKRGKYLQQYLGDAEHHMNKIANELDKWPAPPQPRGKALNMWAGVEEQRIPDWFDRFCKGEGMSAKKI
ncbi:MAG: acyl-CoA dehydrogenase, partial [Dehalococcoidales bacterium]|nr:acyl-CoA dehydrogenase [Dehalococcoidales bacterium]